MAKVKKTYNLDEKVAGQIEEYAEALGMSASAFVTVMVSQIGQVLKIAVGEGKKSDAGVSGDD